VIGEVAEEPATDRPHQESCGEKHRGIELLHDRIVAGKERRGEIQRKRRVGVEIVPFDEIAHRADENRLQPPPHVGEVELVFLRGCPDPIVHGASPECPS
jgi:hypothetical protein